MSKRKCSHCDGTGVIRIQGMRTPCPTCKGTGYHSSKQTVKEVK